MKSHLILGVMMAAALSAPPAKADQFDDLIKGEPAAPTPKPQVSNTRETTGMAPDADLILAKLGSIPTIRPIPSNMFLSHLLPSQVAPVRVQPDGRMTNPVALAGIWNLVDVVLNRTTSQGNGVLMFKSEDGLAVTFLIVQTSSGILNALKSQFTNWRIRINFDELPVVPLAIEREADQILIAATLATPTRIDFGTIGTLVHQPRRAK
jgi:hypothetical protein